MSGRAVRADLHCHSNVSDGTLAPSEVLALASAAQLDWFALTDHDTVDGLAALGPAPDGLQVVAGVEISTVWSGVGIHVLGLGVDPNAAALHAGLARQSAARTARATRIAEILNKAGLHVPLANVQLLAGGVPGRPHFARYLHETEQVANERAAYKRYLGDGRPCDIKTGWATLEEVVSWITSAGGVAVLAHPARYRMSRTKLGRLVDAFTAAGGGAIEVLSGRQTDDVTAHLAGHARRRGLLASCGSDFHRPGQSWCSLGMTLRLPPDCEPVWSLWER